MRTRSKSTDFVSAGHYMDNTEFNYTNPDRTDSYSFVNRSTIGLSYPREVSTITDVEPSKPETFVDSKTGKTRFRKKIRPSISFDTGSGQKGLTRLQIRPAKPCHHVSRKVEFCSNYSVSHQRVNSPGNLAFESTDTRTLVFQDGLQLIDRFVPVFTIPEYLDGNHGSLPDYWGHDWFALADRFREACDQFIPSNSLIGESIVENEIFIDAFKAVLNPSRAVLSLLHAGKTLGRKIRRMRLGRACHQIAKSSANAHLTYAFGIRPAIDEIINVLSAHQRVSKRLDYLRSNAGRFVPIRVKQELPSSNSFDSEPPSVPGGFYTQDLQWQTTKMVSTARIGMWGRVRSDINHRSNREAYLQYFGINKVAGLAWELVPFSFVIDWFSNAQEHVNSLTRLNYGGPFVEFTNLSCSIKTEKTDELFLVPGYDSSFGGDMIDPKSALSVAKITTTDYQRMTSIPDTSGTLDFSVLGLFHAITGGGLIIQRI